MKNLWIKKITVFLFFVALFTGISALVMLLWNALIPEVIGWSAIGYWQAAGLLLLSRMLFGGFGCHRHMAGRMFYGRRSGGFHHGMGEPMMDWHGHMGGMSHDERREFIRNRMAGFAETCDAARNRKTRNDGGINTPDDTHE